MLLLARKPKLVVMASRYHPFVVSLALRRLLKLLPLAGFGQVEVRWFCGVGELVGLLELEALKLKLVIVVASVVRGETPHWWLLSSSCHKLCSNLAAVSLVSSCERKEMAWIKAFNVDVRALASCLASVLGCRFALLA
ncbi:putative 6,7-dimethyl-8-ribityllumazine synthase [Candidatus Hodgkinia cicadicola Dsem]|nr:putative 6,7-dimethyl-8-ribityllumazine synthase [Candidatus Hodgkinia cicadicola Dsem]